MLLAGIWVFQFLWFRFPHLVNRETVSYVVFGVLTTVVNIVAFQVCFNTFPMTPVLRNTVSNTIAWILAVVFAYVVNKLFVFQSKITGFKELLWEAGKFVGARLLSYVVDMAGMLLLVNLLHVNSGLSKIGMNVIVMIMNYFFSKWFIFKEADAAPVDREEKNAIKQGPASVCIDAVLVLWLNFPAKFFRSFIFARRPRILTPEGRETHGTYY